MSGPWFRRYAVIGYKPVTWQGRAVVAAMVAVFVPCAVARMSLEETHPTLAWAVGSIGVLAAVAGNAIALWKMDWGYDRR